MIGAPEMDLHGYIPLILTPQLVMYPLILKHGNGTSTVFVCVIQTYLVGGWATPLKNMRSSLGMISNPIY